MQIMKVDHNRALDSDHKRASDSNAGSSRRIKASCEQHNTTQVGAFNAQSTQPQQMPLQ